MKIALLLLICCDVLLAKALAPSLLAQVKNGQVSFHEVFGNLVQQQNLAGLRQLLSQNDASLSDFVIIRKSLLKREEQAEQTYRLLRKVSKSGGNHDFVLKLVNRGLYISIENFTNHVVELSNNFFVEHNNLNRLNNKLLQKTLQQLKSLNLAYENFEYLYINMTNGNKQFGKFLREKVDLRSKTFLTRIEKELPMIDVDVTGDKTFNDLLVVINSLLKELVSISSGASNKFAKLVSETDKFVYDVKRSAIWVVQDSPILDSVVSDIDLKIMRKLIMGGVDKKGKGDNDRGRTAPEQQPDFLLNLNQQAEQGNLLPVIGREQELAEIFEVLGQHLKSNPILIGEAGVGKTAVIEGLAQKIVTNDVPAMLDNKIIYAVDVGLLLQGNRYVGDIERKVMQMLDFIKRDSGNIIFIDEFHRLMGTRYGQGVAELLKPALSRGEICCIAATTIGEYQKYILNDPAMARRFQAVTIDEPSPADALKIIYGLRSTFSEHHQIIIANDALEAAVHLTQQFLPDKKLPDKAIEVLDRASSALKITGNDSRELHRQHIAKVISDRTDIPVERILQDKLDMVSNLLSRLQNKIVGQDQALITITEVLTASYLGLTEKNRPLAIFMLAGPTGVGKTETAKVLAEALFDSEKHFFRLDMSEYHSRYTVSKLIGSPPGYINSADGGILTNRVKATPHSLVLFDEIEKAHENVYPLLLQVLEDGRLTDGRGNTVDFSNTVIIFTTNADNLTDYFSSEFLGRIDDVIHYQPLTANHMRLIVKKQVEILNDNLSTKGINLTISDSATDALIKQGFNEQAGARSLRATFKRLISFQLAQKINNSQLTAGQYQLDFSKTSGWQLTSADGSVISLESQRPKKSSTKGTRRGYL